MSCHEALRREGCGAQLLGSAVLPPSLCPIPSSTPAQGLPEGSPSPAPTPGFLRRITHSSTRKGEMNDGLEKSLRTDPVS